MPNGNLSAVRPGLRSQVQTCFAEDRALLRLQEAKERLLMKMSSLAPNPKNPRKITDAKRSMLKKSILEHGDLGGVVFNTITKRLVGGHRRTEVIPHTAKITITKTFDPPTRTGTVAVGYIRHKGERYSYREVAWDEQRELAAAIAANQHGGEWDRGLLSEQLLALDHLNFDMDLVGMDEQDLERYIVPIEKLPPIGDPDTVPALPKRAKTHLGDVYQLGDHRLMCGDATSVDQVEKLLGGGVADMVLTDPPYGVDLVKNSHRLASLGYRAIEGDDTIQAATDAYHLVAGMGIPVLIFWGANYYASALPNSSAWIVWDKQGGKQIDFGDGELAWTNLKKPMRIFTHIWDGFRRSSEKGEKRSHPTQKPIALAEWCFEHYAPEAKTVLDLFGGSGWSLIACEKSARRCFMMELDPLYCDVIVKRWEDLTGRKAARVDA